MELEAKGELLEAAKIYKAILEEDETNVVRKNRNENGDKEQFDSATKTMDRGCVIHDLFILLGNETAGKRKERTQLARITNNRCAFVFK